MSEIAERPEGESPESLEEKNNRMARGEITEAEVQEYWQNPSHVLFEHKLEKLDVKVRALTRQFLDSTLASLKDSWDEPTFKNLKDTLEKYFEQKESGKPCLLNVEYYIATDTQDNPLGMTGLYTTDIQGGAGFATREKLDPKKHNLNIGLGWFAVSKQAQGAGLGKYLLDWTENVARSRGGDHFEIETDDWSNSKKALKMYEKSGYEEGFPMKDFYGEGRDLNIYYCDCSKEKEQKPQETSEIGIDDKDQILEIAKENYSSERFEEFKVCLDIFLSQDKNTNSILNGKSVVTRDKKDVADGFAIFADGIYSNSFPVFWVGARGPREKAKVLSALKLVAKKQDKDVIMIYNENEDKEFKKNGFTRAKHGVPGAFAKEDETRFLQLSKKLK